MTSSKLPVLLIAVLTACASGCRLSDNLDPYGTTGSDAGPTDSNAPDVDASQEDVADPGCSVGASRPCYSGAAPTKGVGVCRGGDQQCVAGQWGACIGEVLPSSEVCDGRDEDCNGVIDDGCPCGDGGCPCVVGAERACGSSTGECKPGKQSCAQDGAWGSCAGEVGPELEECDGKDNNCDGSIDESLSQSCYSGPAATSGVGACKAGTQDCASGAWGVCLGQVLPASEQCDGQDNDCDGAIDDGIAPESCYTGPAGTLGVGACQGGTRGCVAGQWGVCEGETIPSEETCNSVDDDCNGTVDDEHQTIHAGGPCDQQCISNTNDADCDGLAGDGTQDKWPSECNPLVFAEGFVTMPGAPAWEPFGTVTHGCGKVTLEAGSWLKVVSPPGLTSVSYLAETRVTMGPEVSASEWKVGIVAAWAGNSYRSCFVWKFPPFGVDPIVMGEISDHGTINAWGVYGIHVDSPPGKTYIVQSWGDAERHYCRVVQDNGSALVSEVWNPGPTKPFTEAGSVAVRADARSADFDYLRIFNY